MKLTIILLLLPTLVACNGVKFRSPCDCVTTPGKLSFDPNKVIRLLLEESSGYTIQQAAFTRVLDIKSPQAIEPGTGTTTIETATVHYIYDGYNRDCKVTVNIPIQEFRSIASSLSLEEIMPADYSVQIIDAGQGNVTILSTDETKTISHINGFGKPYFKQGGALERAFQTLVNRLDRDNCGF